MKIILMLLWLVLATVWADDFAGRQSALEHQLMAPCCYGGLVASHQSGAAFEMRAEIGSMLQAGKTNQEILDHFVQKHGKRILAEPEGDAGVLLTSIPIVVGVLGLIAVALAIRKLRTPERPVAATGPIDLEIPED